jgi:hypothetical protein
MSHLEIICLNFVVFYRGVNGERLIRGISGDGGVVNNCSSSQTEHPQLSTTQISRRKNHFLRFPKKQLRVAIMEMMKANRLMAKITASQGMPQDNSQKDLCLGRAGWKSSPPGVSFELGEKGCAPRIVVMKFIALVELIIIIGLGYMLHNASSSAPAATVHVADASPPKEIIRYVTNTEVFVQPRPDQATAQAQAQAKPKAPSAPAPAPPAPFNPGAMNPSDSIPTDKAASP